MNDIAHATKPKTCDPVTLEIVKGSLRAAQLEMETLLERTAVSPVIREKKDFFAGYFDPQGALITGTNLPIFGHIIQPLFDYYPSQEMRPGDLYWYNDCYASKGGVSHSPDQVFAAPVYYQGRLVGFSQSWAHFNDIGGAWPGSMSPTATDIFQEGIMIPPVRLYREGVINEEIYRIFLRNSRFPEELKGDIRAMIAAVRLGDKRFIELFERFGADMVEDAFRKLNRQTRDGMVRQLRETFRPGRYDFADAIDGDGQGNGPFKIRMTLDVTPDKISIDTTRTDDQAPGPVNFLMNPAVPRMVFGIYAMARDPSLLINEGAMHAVDEVKVREGSLVQPKFPAPLNQRGLTMIRVQNVCAGLMNVASGGESVAASAAYSIFFLRGHDKATGQPFLIADGVGVGHGARPFADGHDGVYYVAQENNPAEFLDQMYPAAPAALRDAIGFGRSGALARRRGRGPRGAVARARSHARDPHRRHRQSGLGRQGRPSRPRRPLHRQSRHRARDSGAAALGQRHRQEWRHHPHGNLRRRRLGPSLRPRGSARARRRARRLCQRRQCARRLRRGGGRARRFRTRRGRNRPPPARGALRHRAVPQWRLRRGDGLAMPDASRHPSDTAAIAVDIGGTFTDIVAFDRAGKRLWNAKVPSTPSDQSLGFDAGVMAALQAAGLAGRDVGQLFHGTTVATNLILEGKGAAAALLTTKGFRHVLEIGRHDIPRKSNLYAWVRAPRPVPPERIFEIAGRHGPMGEEIDALDDAAIAAAARRIKALGIRAVAICFIHSYANPAHERRARDIVQAEYPEAQISLSAEVLPVFREYERSMVTILNSVVMPAVSTYVGRLEERMAARGVSAPLLLMKSSGGVTGAAAIRRAPVLTALSGPAAGAIGANFIGAAAGYRNLITIDIGGTSADICLIKDGVPGTTTGARIGEWPMPLPMIDIHTIGAGGGSIASISPSSGLTVGPRSAGAEPGPVAYGRGGTEPTVTDAHLTLGHLPAHLLDGRLALDREAAAKAVNDKVAKPLGLGLEAAARGILAVIDNNMVGAIRVVSVERGHDPRDFVLVPFGGAGPLHGGALARLLGIKTILIPPAPGVLSALGLLASNLKSDYARTCLQRPPRLRSRGDGKRVRRHGGGGRGLVRARAPAQSRAPHRAPCQHALCRPGLRAHRAVDRRRGQPGFDGGGAHGVPRFAPPALHLRPGRHAGGDRHAARHRHRPARRPRPARPRRQRRHARGARRHAARFVCRGRARLPDLRPRQAWRRRRYRRPRHRDATRRDDADPARPARHRRSLRLAHRRGKRGAVSAAPAPQGLVGCMRFCTVSRPILRPISCPTRVENR